MGVDIGNKSSIRTLSQPPSLENPFVGRGRYIVFPIRMILSQPPSLENPFVGEEGFQESGQYPLQGLNLQAWRIPLWARREKAYE